MRHHIANIAAVAVCILLFAGCASGTTSERAPAADSSTAQPQEILPRRGGDLFIAIPEDLKTLDPLNATSGDLVDFYSLIYQAPFAYDETGRLHNVLIDSWDVSADGTTYTFRFRDDVFFSDGTPLTANDVFESARRALEYNGDVFMTPEATPEPSPSDSTESESPALSAALPLLAPYPSRFAQYGRDIIDIRLVDDAVVIETSTRSNDLLRFMTFPVTKNGGDSLALGTGPYMMSDTFTPGEQIALEVSTSWWGEEPYIERIVAVPASDQSDKISMQQTSLIDFVTTDVLNAGNYAVKGQTKVIDYMTNYFDCLVPNINVPGLSNPEVRRAISEAIDRREILSTILLNHGVPTNLPIAPDSFIMDARFRSNQRDTAAALQLLGQAGYKQEQFGNGRTLAIDLIVPDAIDSTYKKEAARAIRRQLADVFIEVTVEELDESEYLRRLATGEYDLAYCSYYLSTVPDLSFMVQQNGAGNFNSFSDTQIDIALQDCTEALTEEEYIAAYARLQELLNVHMPIIGLYFRMNSIICDESIGGISNVREETIYDDISSWYTMSITRPLAAQSSAATQSSTPANHQTQPDIASTSAIRQ